jgi:hypothetical protein
MSGLRPNFGTAAKVGKNEIYTHDWFWQFYRLDIQIPIHSFQEAGMKQLHRT